MSSTYKGFGTVLLSIWGAKQQGVWNILFLCWLLSDGTRPRMPNSIFLRFTLTVFIHSRGPHQYVNRKILLLQFQLILTLSFNFFSMSYVAFLSHKSGRNISHLCPFSLFLISLFIGHFIAYLWGPYFSFFSLLVLFISFTLGSL